MNTTTTDLGMVLMTIAITNEMIKLRCRRTIERRDDVSTATDWLQFE